MGKWCLHLFSVAFEPILFILAGNEDMHKISDEFEFRPGRTTDYGVSCPWASKIFPMWNHIIMGKCCLHASSFIFDRITIKVAGNQDRHKSSDKFDFRPDQSTHFGVTCPWMTKMLHFRTWISLRPVGRDVCLKHLNDFCGCTTYWNCSEWNQIRKIAYNLPVKGKDRKKNLRTGGRWIPRVRSDHLKHRYFFSGLTWWSHSTWRWSVQNLPNLKFLHTHFDLLDVRPVHDLLCYPLGNPELCFQCLS